jgi:hypothetical protein
MADLPASLVRYQQLTTELSDKYVIQGDLAGDIHEAKVAAYHQSISQGDNVTTARHHADVAAKSWSVEHMKIQGEIDASLVELRYLDQLIAWENHA